jgi:hypothetical protein
MTRKTFLLPAEQPWQADTIIVADTCAECRMFEPTQVWNRLYAVCPACAERLLGTIQRKFTRDLAEEASLEPTHGQDEV